MRRLDGVWGRKVARLPAEGVLLYATDLQGNLRDYERMKALYFAELEAGREAVLAFCGDLVHGPSPDLNEPGGWLEHLGTEYRDESAELLLDFEGFTRRERAFSLMGNHEHAHVGGPVVPKFWPDEAAVLDEALGDERARMHDFIRSFPLLAVLPCGVVLTHGAPGGTAGSLEGFEDLDYAGYEGVHINHMYRHDALGALLWTRGAEEESARRLLQVCGFEQGVVAFGHDVVKEGWEAETPSQICVSTSYGLWDRDKVYLRLELGGRYRSAAELRPGVEILPLY